MHFWRLFQNSGHVVIHTLPASAYWHKIHGIYKCKFGKQTKQTIISCRRALNFSYLVFGFLKFACLFSKQKFLFVISSYISLSLRAPGLLSVSSLHRVNIKLTKTLNKSKISKWSILDIIFQAKAEAWFRLCFVVFIVDKFLRKVTRF